MASPHVIHRPSKADIDRAMRHVRRARLQLSPDDIQHAATYPVYVFSTKRQRDIEWLRRQPRNERRTWAEDDPERVILLTIGRRMADLRDGNLHCYALRMFPAFIVVEWPSRRGIEARILCHTLFELPEWRSKWIS